MQTKRDKSTYPGRPQGSRNQSTIKRLALKQLESVLLDETASAELRTKAALRLTEVKS